MRAHKTGESLFSDLSAIATASLSRILSHDMVVDPLRHEEPRFTDRCFRMVNAIKGRTCIEGLSISLTMLCKLGISCYDSAFTIARDVIQIDVHGAVSLSRRISSRIKVKTLLRVYASDVQRFWCHSCDIPPHTCDDATGYHFAQWLKPVIFGQI